MRLRKLQLMGVAIVVIAMAVPAHAVAVVRGAWTPSGWASTKCGANVNLRSCHYEFSSAGTDPTTGEGHEFCEESSASVAGGVRVVVPCNVYLHDGMATINPRVNAAGQRVGCVSTSGSGLVDLTSGTPSVSELNIPVRLEVHDGQVHFSQIEYHRDGRAPDYGYTVDGVFNASCNPGANLFGGTVTSGTFTVHD